MTTKTLTAQDLTSNHKDGAREINPKLARPACILGPAGGFFPHDDAGLYLDITGGLWILDAGTDLKENVPENQLRKVSPREALAFYAEAAVDRDKNHGSNIVAERVFLEIMASMLPEESLQTSEPVAAPSPRELLLRSQAAAHCQSACWQEMTNTERVAMSGLPVEELEGQAKLYENLARTIRDCVACKTARAKGVWNPCLN